MNETHARYLLGLRARHAAAVDSLRPALARRHPGTLKALERRHAAIERETEEILSAIGSRSVRGES